MNTSSKNGHKWKGYIIKGGNSVKIVLPPPDKMGIL